MVEVAPQQQTITVPLVVTVAVAVVEVPVAQLVERVEMVVLVA